MYVCTLEVCMYSECMYVQQKHTYTMNVCIYNKCMHVHWMYVCTLNVCIIEILVIEGASGILDFLLYSHCTPWPDQKF